MEKSWFIFQEDHHLGPFSTSEIREMLELGKINQQVPLWKEGIDDWYPLEHYSDFSPKVDPVQKQFEAEPEPEPEVLPTIDDLEDIHEDHFEQVVADELPGLPDLPELPSFDDTTETQSDSLTEDEIQSIEPHETEIQELEDDLLPELPDLPELPNDIEVEETIEPLPVVAEEPSFEENSFWKEDPVEETVEEVEPPLVENISQNVDEPEPEPEFKEEPAAEEVAIAPDTQEQESELEEELDWDEVGEKSSGKKFNLKFLAASVACVLIAVATYITISSTFKVESDYSGLIASQVEKINDIRSLSFEKSFQAKVFVSKDNKELYLATNLPHQAKAYLTLSSVSKRVIGSGEVVVTANSIINNGVAKFSKLSLIKGERFLPGEYYVKLSTVPIGINHKVNKFLNKKLKFDLFKPNENHRYRGKDFIFQGTREEFVQRLESYFAKALEKKKVPYKDQLEKYRTFSQMSRKVFVIYEEVLTSIRRGKDIESFELLYAKEAGPILQSVILDTHSLFKKYEVSDPSISSLYEEVLEVGKKVGEMASDMVTMTQKKKRLRKKSRERLLKLFKKRSKFISEEADTKARKTSELIEGLKL